MMGGSVAIVGLGLIGGSIARRLSEAGWSVGWIDPGVDAAAVREEVPALEPIETSGLPDYRIIVLATPTGTAIDLIGDLDSGPGIVTSVCSVMKPLADEAARRSIRFVAGHPMAGREVKGWPHSIPDLFEGRPWFRSAGDAQAVDEVDRLIEACGASVVPIDPDEHDRYAALASHLPQLLSSALAAAIEESDIPEPFRGPGLKTFLRLAGSSWPMWEPVFEHNAEAVAEAREALEVMIERVLQGKGEDVFERANELYRKL